MNHSGEPTVEELMARIAALQAENRELTERVVKLEEELVLARLHRFAPKSEKHVDRLFNEAEQVADEEDAGDEDDDLVDLPDTGFPSTEKPQGKKRGRKPLPEHLPRERVEYDLPDDQKACPCCRHQMHRMGEAVTEQLHIELKAKVLQNVRFKYACRHCDRTGINTPVVLAPMPAQPLPGSIATASTLAFALVHKYVDGTPLYRLAQAFERAGVPVSRGALGHWVIGSSERHLSRIYEALKLRLRSQALIHGDETTVQVLKEKDREATSTSYMWAYRSGEDSNEPIVLLDYQPGRGQIYPQAFLGDYHGILMSDGYTAWRTLAGATHLGCMAHSRRRFVDALKTRKKGGGPPEQALKFFEQLYRIESQARGEKAEAGETQADCLRRFRQQHSVPILIALKAWLDAIAPKVLPDSKIGDAVSYTLNQWEYLTRYTEDGRMPIDNNLLERDIRIFATGRKSWLFSDTVDGAKASAVVYSLMLTCRACGIEPLAYLRHILSELPQRASEADITDPAAIPLRQSRPRLIPDERVTATPVKRDASTRMEMSAYVETAGRDNGEHDGGTIGPTLGTSEGPVSTPECNSSQRALGRIVRETNPAIVEETRKTIPSLQHVIDRLDHLGRFAERGALPFQPLVHVIEQRLALFLPRGQSFFGAQSIDLALHLKQRVVPLDGFQGDRRDRLAFAFAIAGTFLDVGQLKEFAPRVRMAKGEGDRYRFLFGDTERLEAVVAITLQNAAILGQVLLRVLAAAVARRIVYGRWRCRSTVGPVIAHVGPYSPGRAFVFGLNGDGGVVAKKALGREDMRLDQIKDRQERGRSIPDLVG